ncbi:aspartyl-phosphate phosphatase Spo0E family protein [Paenibacillus sp. B01]|uniref:aspartyl-phosphate phosphatase Spo0E family protein n=1 Tax=Paenibacillus sp. B01 TaxID=2660554 RepID=UPI00129BD23D|nr:aspartyl-phosphate phosphatase Spo0E family protein [Paenibacillus sp. B01]QGG57701.1 Spo0E family sporulation regulatory protein-aspartic acid phosphatase [Paenibacillus sp. B01]
MDLNVSRILEAVEQKRTEMIKAAEQCGIRSELVLFLSQELDALLNDYDRIRKRRGIGMVS